MASQNNKATALPANHATARYRLDPDDRPATVPTITNWQSADGRFQLASEPRLVIAPGARGGSQSESSSVGELFVADLNALTDTEIKVGVGSPAAGDFVLEIDPTLNIPAEGGYRVVIDDTVRITAGDRSGLLYGTQTVLQMLKQDEHRRHLPRGQGDDAPRFAERGQMIDVGRKFLPLEYLRSEIRRMAWLKLNSLQLHLTEWNGFRFESKIFPGLASPEHYTQDQLRELDAYAQTWGVTIVPEIDLPGHAVWISRYEPRLRFRSPVMDRSGWPGGQAGGWMLDITSEFTRAFVRRLLAEVAGVFAGEFVHIGGDEMPLQDDQDNCPELHAYAAAKGYPHTGDVLVDFINDMAATLREHGKRAEIWEWWNHGGVKTSLAPAADIRVSEWLSDEPSELTAQGYETVGVNWGNNFTTPGYSTTPNGASRQGFPGYMPAESVYEKNPYVDDVTKRGFRLGRWMDKSEPEPVPWVHFFAHRPLQVLADRTWGVTGSATAAAFYDRADAIGDPPPDNLTAIPGTACSIVDVSSQELEKERGAAHHVLDADPQTAWVTQYAPDLQLTPHQITIDVGAVRQIAALSVWPRQDGREIDDFHHSKARAKAIEISVSVSDDQETWATVYAADLPNHQPAHTVRFDQIPARYVRLKVISDWENLFVTAIARLSVLEAAARARRP